MKYGNVRVEVDGERFDSRREARRWQELRLLERAGHIRALRRQVRFGLCVDTWCHETGRIGDYVADFVYDVRHGSDWRVVVEDCKGYRTALYRWKAKHFAAQYGITILET